MKKVIAQKIVFKSALLTHRGSTTRRLHCIRFNLRKVVVVFLVVGGRVRLVVGAGVLRGVGAGAGRELPPPPPPPQLYTKNFSLLLEIHRRNL